MSIDFDRVVYFLQICESGSVSNAAERLYISPQALNKQIRTLEEEVGEKLFQRSGHKLTLTDFGIFFRNQMLPVRQLFQTAQAQVARYLDSSRHTLRMGFFQGLPKRRVIQPILTELLIGLPNIQIELGSAEMDEIFSDLRAGKTDLAITYVNPVEPLPDLIQIPLLTIPCAVVISYLHPWMVKETITAEDMAASPVLFLTRAGGPDKEGFYGTLRASSYHYAPSYNSMLAQLGLGQHYAVFPTAFESLGEMGLRTFPLPDEYHAEFRLSLLYRADSRFAEFFSTLSVLQDAFRRLLSTG